MGDEPIKPTTQMGDDLLRSLGDMFTRFLSSLDYDGGSTPKSMTLDVHPAADAKGASQAQVRRSDESMVDDQGRKVNEPGFGSSEQRPEVQEHIERITERAQAAAELLNAGKSLHGTGYETAKQDFDRWFGKDAFEDFIVQEQKRDFNEKFDTSLSPDDEKKFAEWKAKHAPSDSGDDYDLRGAFKSGLTPDAKTGHWPDTFKKPNHPTFSDESRYAKFGRPGRWEGEAFVRPVPESEE